MRPAEPVELALDGRLVRATALTAAACLIPAVLVAAALDGRKAALAALWGVVVVGLNGVAAAWISAQGGRTERGIGIGRVLVALPIRMLGLAAAVLLGVGPLGLPGVAVGFAVIGAESAVMVVQSWLVLHGATFVGPLEKGVSG